MDAIHVQPPPQMREYFQEAWYLEQYSDVAKSIKSGSRESAWNHFSVHGYAEGRLGFPLNAEWYVRAYPVADLEIRAGLARNAQDHYVLFGAARGYLPERSAPRPQNAAKMRQRFGGLWIDSPNGRDLIEGRLEIGSITSDEAHLLHKFREQGYVVLNCAIPDDLLGRGRAALEQAYEGSHDGLKFECHSVAKEHISWRREIIPFPSKALDIHMFSSVLRDVMFADRVRRFLHILFESQPLASQTLGFLRGSAQEAHQDSAYVAYSIPCQFVASWIALEDVAEHGGELFYFPGSQRFEDYIYGEKYKSLSEAKRGGCDSGSLTKELVGHVTSLTDRAAALGIPKATFMARAGDALIWHSELVHGGMPVSRDMTRKSLVTHYCPRLIAPLFMESGASGYFRHASGAYFTSGAYPRMSPRS